VIPKTEGRRQVNKEVNLTKRIKTPQGLRFCPVVISANGRVKPDYVLISGKEQRHPEGAYYLEWREDGKRVRQSVGRDAAAAAARRHRQQQILGSKAAGIKLVDEGQDDGLSLATAVAGYLEDVRISKKPKTYAAYKKALEYFLESCNKTRVTQIERQDLLRFSAFLRDVKILQPRTVYNKFENVMSFLKANHIGGLASKNDWPRYVEDEPEIYEREDLDKFFAACDEDERLWFEFFLMTGMRKQEAMHTTWPNINLNRGVVTVRYKREYGFSPKAYKGREIPIPNKLVTALKKWKTKSGPGCPLLFPAAGASQNRTFWMFARPLHSARS